MFIMDSIHKSLVIDIFSQQIRLQAVKSWSAIAWLQSYFLPIIDSFADELIVSERERVSLSCNIVSSAGSSVLWLYTPGEAYAGVRHIYTEGLMVSGWRSRCQVSTNATSSTLVLPSVQPNDAGYYECSEEYFDRKDIRSRIKLIVSDVEGSTPNIAEIFDVFNDVMFISGISLVLLLITCTLLALLVTLKNRRNEIKSMHLLRKVMAQITDEDNMTNCKTSPIWKIEDGAFRSSLLLSQSAKEHPPLPSDRISLKSDDLNDYRSDGT